MSFQFNRHPLSDTPVHSHSGSPLAQGAKSPPVSFKIPPLQLQMSPPLGPHQPTSGQLPPLPTVPNSNNNNSNNNSHNINNGSSSSSSSNALGTSYDSKPTSRSASTSGSASPALQLPSRRAATTLDVPGLTRSKVSPDGAIAARDVESKLVIVMVGLPARGKSYVTKKLCRYLNWQQHGARIFNVGNTRRKASENLGPSKGPLPDEKEKLLSVSETPGDTDGHSYDNSNNNNNNNNPNTNDADPHDSTGVNGSSMNGQTGDFFSPDNEDSFKLREKWAMDTLEDLLDYVLEENGSVGILDATNTTVARRRKVLDRIKERSGGRLKVLFLESVCSNNSIIEANIRLKLSGPDYKDVDTDIAIQDFITRMRNYEKVYQTIGSEEEADEEFQYIKMIDVGRKVVCYNIQGFLAGQAVFFLLNFNLAERQIWITRHGESEDNAIGKIGGDAPLTARGTKFAAALARFIKFQKKEFRKTQLKNHMERTRILQRGSNGGTPSSEPDEPHFCVWTSMMKRSIETGQFFDDYEDLFDVKEMRMLNELGAGICDGMTYEEIKAKYPLEYESRMSDKVQYRYPGPGGESYLDVINRLRPVIVEIERMTDNALIIGHRVVCRILLAYFMNLGREAIGDLDVPLHTLYCLEPKPYGVEWQVYEYNDETDWFYKIDKEIMKTRELQKKGRQFSVVPTDISEVSKVLGNMGLGTLRNSGANGIYHPQR